MYARGLMLRSGFALAGADGRYAVQTTRGLTMRSSSRGRESRSSSFSPQNPFRRSICDTHLRAALLPRKSPGPDCFSRLDAGVDAEGVRSSGAVFDLLMVFR